MQIGTKSMILRGVIAAFAALLASCSSDGVTGRTTLGTVSNGPQAGSMRTQLRTSTGGSYTFTALISPSDPKLTQAQGINDSGMVVGTYGNGSYAHPTEGFEIGPPYSSSDFTTVTFPDAAESDAVAINNRGVVAGFWVDNIGVNRAFTDERGRFESFQDPINPGMYSDNHIFGLNDKGDAVGFYTDNAAGFHAYKLVLRTKQYTELIPPNSSNPVATGINDKSEIVGAYEAGSPSFRTGFLFAEKKYTPLVFPGSTWTFPYAISNSGTIVGYYVDSSGHGHGFVLTNALSNPAWETVDVPNALGTSVNGINAAGDLVGFYEDGSKNVIGFVATP